MDVLNVDVRTAKLKIGFQAAEVLVFGIENLLALWIGAKIIMQPADSSIDSVFTIGMLFAFVNYKEQFTKRIAALVNYLVEIKMLSLHVERLGDIVLTPPEKSDVPFNDLSHLTSEIELRRVSFRYGESEPWIFQNLNLTLTAGQSIAIVGASGCGKTTLLKVLLGLLKPQEGKVLYGGEPIEKVGILNYRLIIDTVMQEDTLLSGCIADNSGFFDTTMNELAIVEAAELAAVHEDIVKMPMGYQILVGDNGAALSGGQKQRILLARALYKHPKVLALDEATSHLDVTNEGRVINSLARLPLTRIVVAHRPETIASAQRIVRLESGSLTEDSEKASKTEVPVKLS